MTPAAIVLKLWNYCNVLRDDLSACVPACRAAAQARHAQAGGMSYGDYPSTSLRAGSKQLTYLLFLKMADERTKAPWKQKSPVPEKYSWPALLKRDGDELFDYYRHSLEGLANHRSHYC